MTKYRRSIVATCLLAGGAPWLWANIAAAQNFLSQGPAPSFGLAATVQSGDQPPNGTVAGAIQTIAISPVNSSTMFVGATNGGIWTTRNGGSSWAADRQQDLDVDSSVAFDPTDAGAQKLIAGVGATSNGRIGDAKGGQLTGIMYSSNGGANWTDLAGSGGTLSQKNIVSVAARGGNLLAAANDDIAKGGGLYYSPNGGSTFSLVSGLAAGCGVRAGGRQQQQQRRRQRHPLLRLAEPRRHARRQRRVLRRSDQARDLGAGAVAGRRPRRQGVDGAGRIGRRRGLRQSSGNPTSGKLVGIYLSQNSGATWASMTTNLPDTNPAGRHRPISAVAIDPSNPNIVYVAGDAKRTGAATVPAFRLTLTGSTFSVDSLTDDRTANGSTVHADARTMVFDASGRLVFGGDGGIYLWSNPTSANGIWTGLNTSTLSVREIYGIAYDGVSKRMIVASQDSRTAFQAGPNTPN